MWDNCIAAEWLDGLKHSHVWTGAIFFSSNSLFECEQLVNLQSTAFPDSNLEKREWREGSGRGKQWHTPLHLFVVLSRMAFVETILPYLKEKGESLFFMYQTEPVIKYTHTHAKAGRVEQQSMTSLVKYEKQEVVSMVCWKSTQAESSTVPFSLAASAVLKTTCLPKPGFYLVWFIKFQCL